MRIKSGEDKIMQKQKNKQKGITLIALVVTIIVLIILAGVSINMLVGENGIITQAQTAKEENGRAEIIEKIQLEITEKQTENLGTINEEEFYEILEKYGTVSSDETILTTTEGSYEIAIADIYSGELETVLVKTPLESWEYTINGNNIILNKYIGINEKILVPDFFIIDNETYQTKLSHTNYTENVGPFVKNSTIKEIKFEEGIQTVDEYANRMFQDCINLKKVYNLPSSYTNLSNTFENCIKLEEVVSLPSNTINMSATFNGCIELKKVPEIPSKVTSMLATFINCKSLTGTIIINSNDVSDVTNCFSGCPNRIYLKVTSDSLTFENFNNAIKNNTWNNITFEDSLNIVCWGDSLTQGSYPSLLQSLCDNNVYITNMGIGGENSQTIAVRQGGIELQVDAFTIPSDISLVEINLKTKEGNTVDVARRTYTNGLNPCYINGIMGNISYSNEKYYFSRESLGEESLVESNTQVITDGLKNYRDDLMIIWAGTNDTPSIATIQNVIDNIDSMIEYSTNPNYIVIGLTSKSYMPEVEEVNKILAEKYGEHFLDIRKYILENGLSDAGIVATEQDEIDVNNGEIPSSLRADNVHFNDYGYTIVAEQVYNKLIELGYIEE